MVRAIIVAWIIAFPSTGSAEQSKVFGAYVIHYAVISSLLIPESVARQHQLVRSDKRLVANLSIRRRDGSDSSLPPLEARVWGTVTNLLQQPQSLSFVTVNESGTSYYLASFIESEKQRLTFNVNIHVAGEPEAFVLQFARHYRIPESLP